ncbi:MAG TPA: nickel-dependent lactate racemase [Bacillota bacterium]
MARRVCFKYGKGTIEVPLPDGEVLATLSLRGRPPLTDPAAAIRDALRRPIASPPLAEVIRPGDSVCVLLNDPTRLANTDTFLPVLLDELNRAGVRDQDIFGVFATGSHRALTEAEVKAIAGKAAGRIRLFNHDATDQAGLAYAGRTSRGNEVYLNRRVLEADRVILTGGIVYHFFAGFGGGRKAMVPGVAGYQTIQFNHRLMLEPGAEIGRLAGNPVHEDLLEAARLGSPDFLVNVVLDEARRFLGVFAGDLVAAHEAGCRLVREVYGVPLARQADLVVASAGGHPKDINVYQLQKTMDNAVLAARPGGVVILLAECPEGHGNDTYHRWMTNYRSPERIEAAIREHFELGGHKAYAVTRLMRRAHFILYSSLPESLARELLFEPAASPEKAVAAALERLGTDRLAMVLMPDAGLTVPTAM